MVGADRQLADEISKRRLEVLVNEIIRLGIRSSLASTNYLQRVMFKVAMVQLAGWGR